MVVTCNLCPYQSSNGLRICARLYRAFRIALAVCILSKEFRMQTKHDLHLQCQRYQSFKCTMVQKLNLHDNLRENATVFFLVDKLFSHKENTR